MGVSPHVGAQTPSPQTHAGQSLGQLVDVSPQSGSQIPLPHAQVFAQSDGQLVTVSPQLGWHCPLPHEQLGEQSAQVLGVSPQVG